MSKDKYRRIWIAGIGLRAEHSFVAEKALGRKLPKLAVVHHVDENKGNNDPRNLVICPSQAYHKLLHLRVDALNESGHADWIRCRVCKKHDEQSNLSIRNKKNGQIVAYHTACLREEDRARRERQRGPFYKHGNCGRKRSPEVVERLRLVHVGRKCSPETIEKMRASALLRESNKRVA